MARCFPETDHRKNGSANGPLRTIIRLAPVDGVNLDLLECGYLLGNITRKATLFRQPSSISTTTSSQRSSCSHDAEDAFQAAFLVLVRKAPTIVPREMIGNWLYGVAYHSALKARTASIRRQINERQAGAMAKPSEESPVATSDLAPVLHRELSRLPGHYRVPNVLCEPEGRSRKAAAQELGLS